MKRKISLYTKKSSDYIFINFLKQYKKSLDHYSIGQMLNSKQVLSILSYMGFIDQQPTDQDIQLSKTLTKMLSQSKYTLSIRRANLFHFLTVLCDIQQNKQSIQGSYFQQEISGLAIDDQIIQQPLIIIEFGKFDQCGRWSCNQQEKKQIQAIFVAMRLKRISRNQVESRKKSPKKQQNKETFQPKLCSKSEIIFQQKLKKSKFDKNQPVQNRLLHSKNTYQQKIKQQINRSLQKQLKQCTFKPLINSRSRSSHSQQSIHYLSNTTNSNINSNSISKTNHLTYLLNKGTIYKQRRQKLKQLHIKLNQSSQLQDCTFKPQTTKHSQTTKWAYVRNRDKQIQRLRQGRKYRQFVNQVKQRGYPIGINWSQYINKKQNISNGNNGNQQNNKLPILCIDLKIMNQQYNINVFNGENIVKIAERISKQHKIPQKMWWKVQDLIRKAVEQCVDIRVENNKIYAED